MGGVSAECSTDVLGSRRYRISDGKGCPAPHVSLSQPCQDTIYTLYFRFGAIAAWFYVNLFIYDKMYTRFCLSVAQNQ